MKKIITLLLICAVPFVALAQIGKKSKKTGYEFLVIKGVEIDNKKFTSQDKEDTPTGDEVAESQINELINPKTQLTLSFDFGGNSSKDNQNLEGAARSIKTMASAVNISADYGWRFINSSVFKGEDYTIHYYYMEKR
ncbi:MAG: hypothetical protein VX370_01390 [Bacteroidota bacterium]|nr:hypothetical protein [Bacteroidota bacterium]